MIDGKIILGPFAQVVLVFGAWCEGGHELIPASEFSDGQWIDWPVPCSLELCCSESIHPGCGARLGLSLGVRHG